MRDKSKAARDELRLVEATEKLIAERDALKEAIRAHKLARYGEVSSGVGGVYTTDQKLYDAAGV